jgi:hypothetical protein
MAEVILPEGWFKKTGPDGNSYYYDIQGRVSWAPPPPRPKAPTKIMTFAEEHKIAAHAKHQRFHGGPKGKVHHHNDAASDEEDEEGGDKAVDLAGVARWEEDAEDYGFDWGPPPPTAQLVERMDAVAKAMQAANANYKGRHEPWVRAWGGEPHPRLGNGERLRLGFRPPPAFTPGDNVKAVTQATSKNQTREWMVEVKEEEGGSGIETYPVSAPPGGFQGTVCLVIAADEHSYLLTTAGVVYSWGRNVFGQLGLGDVATRSTPMLVKALAEGFVVTDLSCGGSHALALTVPRAPPPEEAGQLGNKARKKEKAAKDKDVRKTIWSWGKGRDGALGRGDTIDGHTPKPIKSLELVPMSVVSAGSSVSLAAPGWVMWFMWFMWFTWFVWFVWFV